MKKQYIKPVLEISDWDMQPLLTLSPTEPETTVNHEEYNGPFSGRGSDFDDDDI